MIILVFYPIVSGYEATLDTLLEGFHKLQLHNLKVQFDELFLVPQWIQPKISNKQFISYYYHIYNITL